MEPDDSSPQTIPTAKEPEGRLDPDRRDEFSELRATRKRKQSSALALDAKLIKTEQEVEEDDLLDEDEMEEVEEDEPFSPGESDEEESSLSSPDEEQSKYSKVIAELKIVRQEQAAINRKLNFIMRKLVEEKSSVHSRKKASTTRNALTSPKVCSDAVNNWDRSEDDFDDTSQQTDETIFARGSNIYEVFPLKSVEDIQNYFCLRSFCAAAKKVLDIRCEKSKKVVEQFFRLAFTDEVLARVHWPSVKASRVGSILDGTRRPPMPQVFVNFWEKSTQDIASELPPKSLTKATRSYINNRSNKLLEKLIQLDKPIVSKLDTVVSDGIEVDIGEVNMTNIYKHLPLGTVEDVKKCFKIESFCSVAQAIFKLRCDKSVKMIKQFFGIFFTKDVLQKMYWPSKKATRVGQLPDGTKRISFPDSFVSFWNATADKFSSIVPPKVMEKELRRFLLRSRKSEKMTRPNPEPPEVCREQWSDKVKVQLTERLGSGSTTTAPDVNVGHTKASGEQGSIDKTWFHPGANIYNLLPLNDTEKVDKYFRMEGFRAAARKVMNTRCAKNKKVVEDFFAIFFTNEVLAILFWPSIQASRVGFLPDGTRRRPFPQPFVDFWQEATAHIAAALPPNELNSATRHLITNRNGFAKKKTALVPAESGCNTDEVSAAQIKLPMLFPSGTNIYTLLPLQSFESIDQYFRIESFCTEAKKVVKAKWEMDVRIVERFFTFFFNDDILMRSLLPSKKFSRVAQLPDGSKKEYLPQSFLHFWLDATDDIAATLPPKSLEKAVRKFLDCHRRHLQKKKAGKTRRSAKKWPAEVLNPVLSLSGEELKTKTTGEQMMAEETNYMFSILPLNSIEEIQSYFGMEDFCTLSKKLVAMSCHRDIRMVDEAFKMFFTEELMAKLHWPSSSANFGKPEDGVRRVSFPKCFVEFWNSATKDIEKKLPTNVLEKTTRLYLNEVKNRIDTRMRRKGLRKPKQVPLPGSLKKKKRKRQKTLEKRDIPEPVGVHAPTLEATAVSLSQVQPGQSAVMYVPFTFGNSVPAQAVLQSRDTFVVANASHPPGLDNVQWSKDEGQYGQQFSQSYF